MSTMIGEAQHVLGVKTGYICVVCVYSRVGERKGILGEVTGE